LEGSDLTLLLVWFLQCS